MKDEFAEIIDREFEAKEREKERSHELKMANVRHRKLGDIVFFSCLFAVCGMIASAVVMSIIYDQKSKIECMESILVQIEAHCGDGD